jgi:predicted Zn-dependent protease
MEDSRVEALLQMMARDPNDRAVHYMLGNEYFKAQKYSETVEILHRYLQSGDDEGSAYRLLAKSQERLGRIEEARQAYREGIVAAERHGHQPMVEEYTQALTDLE